MFFITAMLLLRACEYLCLVLLQVPKCFVPVQMFWAIPKIWLHLVPLQKLLCQHKNQFYWMQIIFWSGTKCLWLAQYVKKILVWHKKFGPAQNIFGPVKGQGISFFFAELFLKTTTFQFRYKNFWTTYDALLTLKASRKS